LRYPVRCGFACAQAGLAEATIITYTAAMVISLATDSFSHYGPLVVLVAIALVFGLSIVVLSRLTGPGRSGKVKGMVYESGMNPVGTAKRRFNVRFYVVAMSFLVFDVEIVFLYPWATVFPSLGHADGLGVLFLGRMLFFVLTTIIAFAYAWRKGVFSYE